MLVVVLGYNRLNSLENCINSILNNRVEEIDILISIDGGGNHNVIEYALNLKDKYSFISCKIHNKNLGLKNHVLECLRYAIEYDSVMILEDDISVVKGFDTYSTEAVSFCKDHKQICGIALYSPEVNELCGIPFTPMKNGFDNYLMQVPCSWGQVFTSNMINDFFIWLNDDIDLKELINKGLPESVVNWPESSWKKFYYAYMICENKYFIYPYNSYSTNNASENGTHVKHQTTFYQVETNNCGVSYEIKFCEDFNFIKYDSYMEQEGDVLGLIDSSIKICSNIYKLKPLMLLNDFDYVLEVIDDKKISISKKVYRFELKPFEQNYITHSKFDKKNHKYFIGLIEPKLNVRLSPRLPLINYFSTFIFSFKDLTLLILAKIKLKFL